MITPRVNLIERPLDWMRNALGMREPHTPRELRVDEVVPVVDTVQDGWAASQWFQFQHNHASGVGPNHYFLAGVQTVGAGFAVPYTIEGAPWLSGSWIAVLHYLELLHAGGAAAATAELMMWPNVSTGTPLLRILQAAVPNGGQTFPALGLQNSGAAANRSAMGGCTNGIIVPPKAALSVFLPGNAVGESWFVTALVQIAPAGTRVR